MFFILSKTLNYLAMPLVMVVLLMIVSLLLRNARWKKRLFWCGFGLLLFFSNEFIANEVMRAWEIDATPYAAMQEPYTWGIVLTGVTNNDQEPADRVYFSHGADRVTHTVELYKKGLIKKILITGGEGRLLTQARNESDEMLQVMVMMGVPTTDIVVERASRNTYESAINVKKLLADDTSRKLLITSAFHMRRSKASFDKQQIACDVFTCDFYSHPRYFTFDVLIMPKVDAILTWQKVLKEWTGMMAYKAMGYI
jgi:uncharacterized SAM-binding protein YcdF (DUF218 family)